MYKKNNDTISTKQKEMCKTGINATVYSLAIKCYDEQLIDGQQGLVNLIHAVDPLKYQVLAIKHDRDTVADGIWKISTEKPHYHIIMRCTDKKSRIRIKKLMEMLGIYFRQGIDDALWENHGVETVKKFSNYAMYLTHETEAAIKDAKVLYNESELITNLTKEELKVIREGYVRTSSIKKVTLDDLEVLDKRAYALGRDLKNFNEWYDSLPFIVRAHPKMKTIRESYDRGVDARIEEGTKITRLCVFIHGPGNCGKSFAAKQALSGKRVLSVGGGGTGKFDNLRPDHDAIIIDDDECPNLLNMSDNYICRAYRRQSNNPAWAGQYLIVTSNLTFEKWVEKCGITVRDEQNEPTEHYKAVKSRFYICEVTPEDESPIREESSSERGIKEDKKNRQQMYIDFYARFSTTINSYRKKMRNPNEESNIDDELFGCRDEWQTAYDKLLTQVTKMFEENNCQFTQLSFDEWIDIGTIDYSEYIFDELDDYFSEHAEDKPKVV